ncbi:B-4DMT family transporter [Hoyosella rhizosphaerae]|uniref:Uncharacterized protein n=1 Tax=Hoyosella rhizosphaerae TaxID=1755582 RepID=A0A916U3H3_9ACTN|nr:B-4DMT family transporter [Hoyosella rhizosphaerae]MBN4926449.1 B-4DMT family transporter [Hoyosella rhizosphaerae]GGC59259.1 hypothetical protein GCM10011410_09630 [Hoyosella rhizosphaerae]
MNLWLIRGLVIAAVVTFIRALLGIGIYTWPESGSTQVSIALIVALAIGFVWPLLDGYSDGKEFEDEEDRADLTILWLKSLTAGAVISGFVSWLLTFAIPGIGGFNLFVELTIGAGFLILLLSIPALIGIMLGRFLGDRARRRSTPPVEEDEYGRHHVVAHHQKEPVKVSTGPGLAGTAVHHHDHPDHQDASFSETDYRDDDFAAERADIVDGDARDDRR